jgi:hypothetical protein
MVPGSVGETMSEVFDIDSPLKTGRAVATCTDNTSNAREDKKDVDFIAECQWISHRK